MRKTIIALAAIAATTGTFLVATTAAFAGEKQHFEHEGYTYVYEVTDAGAGRVITGLRYPGGTPFTLKVSGDRVKGVSNGAPVSFNVADARGAADGAVIR